MNIIEQSINEEQLNRMEIMIDRKIQEERLENINKQ